MKINVPAAFLEFIEPLIGIQSPLAGHTLKPAVFADYRAVVVILCPAIAGNLGLVWLMILRIKHTACVFKVLASHMIYLHFTYR